jgi:hypothetical protein
MRRASIPWLLFVSGVAACSLVNAPDELESEQSGEAGTSGEGGTSGAGTGKGGTAGKGGNGGTSGSGGSGNEAGAPEGGSSNPGSGGSSGEATTGGSAGLSGGEGGTGTVVPATGLIALGARVTDGTGTSVLSVLDETGAELSREELSVAALAHDGAPGRDVWYVFIAEEIFPIDPTRPADLEVRRFDSVAREWTTVSRTTALPPPRAGQLVVLNQRLAYLSYRNSDQAETLTLLDTTDLSDISAEEVPVTTGADTRLVGLLGARGSATDSTVDGGTLNLMLSECTSATACALGIQPYFVGGSAVAGTFEPLGDYVGSTSFANAIRERRSFVTFLGAGDSQVHLFDIDPFDPTEVDDSALPSMSSTVGGLSLLECEGVVVVAEGNENQLRGVSLAGGATRPFDLMRAGQALHFEPFSRTLLAPFNSDPLEPAPDAGNGMGAGGASSGFDASIDAFVVTGNGSSAPTITARTAAQWSPPADLAPLTLAVRNPETFECE